MSWKIPILNGDNMTLEVVTEYRLEQFKVDIKEAFRFGAAEGMGTDEEVFASLRELVNGV